MRQAVESRPIGQPTGIARKLPAPVQGWWASESIADAPKQTALYLINFFCEADGVRMRRGCVDHATGLGGTVESLMHYRSGIADEMYGCANNGIYDVTGTGAVGAPVVSSLTNNRWSFVNFSNSGGQFLRCVNGFDEPQIYDGTTWGTTPLITGTGLTASELIFTWVFKQRIWFVQKNSTKCWYLDTSAVGGTATAFDFGAQLRKGGYIVAGASWSIDAGDGLDDVFVVISSEGEVLVYIGDDPANAATFQLSGVYAIGRPLNNRCFFNAGGDLVVISESGLLPMSSVITLDEAVLSTRALTRNIYSAYNDAVFSFRDVEGWQIETFPVENMAILNVPTATTTSQQFALNTDTGAWSEFVGWNARCWLERENKIYFGDPDGNVCQASIGGSDKGATIQGTMMLSYDDFGRPGMMKSVTMLRPIYITNTTVTVATTVFTDYEDVGSIFGGNTTASSGGRWDVDFWDNFNWAGSKTEKNWLSATGRVGFALAPAMQVNVDGGDNDTLQMRVVAINAVYENAGIVG